MMTIDLQQFCSTDELYPYLHKPFSRNGFTYATNQHILIRVALRPDIPDVDRVMNVDKPFKDLGTTEFFRPFHQLPPALTPLECCNCDGTGRAHQCHNCDCECSWCNGSGKEDPERLMAAAIGPKDFALNYVRQLLQLPAIEIASFPEQPDEKPLLFRFDGGVGALMPLRGAQNGVDCKINNVAPPAAALPRPDCGGSQP